MVVSFCERNKKETKIMLTKIAYVSLRKVLCKKIKTEKNKGQDIYYEQACNVLQSIL